MRANAPGALGPIPARNGNRTLQEVDHRITLAREYLAFVQQHDVLHLPPSARLRECAESRRQLVAALAAYADLARDTGAEQ
jgi:hypothetical protein